MTTFVDASVIVAILGHEDDWRHQSDRVEDSVPVIWSAIARWESILALRSRLKSDVASCALLVDEFADMNGLALVPIGEREAREATAAAALYGRGSRHRAKLNMGDCFAYACAKTNNARLLYKGDDFIHTDLA